MTTADAQPQISQMAQIRVNKALEPRGVAVRGRVTKAKRVGGIVLATAVFPLAVASWGLWSLGVACTLVFGFCAWVASALQSYTLEIDGFGLRKKTMFRRLKVLRWTEVSSADVTTASPAFLFRWPLVFLKQSVGFGLLDLRMYENREQLLRALVSQLAEKQIPTRIAGLGPNKLWIAAVQELDQTRGNL